MATAPPRSTTPRSTTPRGTRLRVPAAVTLGFAGSVALVMAIVGAGTASADGDGLCSALVRAVSSVPVTAGACLLIMGLASVVHLLAHRRLVWLIAGIPCSVVLVLVVLVVIGLAYRPDFDGLFLAAMVAPGLILLGGTLTVLVSIGLLLPAPARIPVTVAGVVFVGASAVCGLLALRS